MVYLRARHTSSLVLAAAVALGLSACTSSPPAVKAKPASPSSSPRVAAGSAAALFQQMRNSSTAAKSVRIKGALGNATNTAARVQIDIAGDRAGKNTRVTANDGTGALEILTVGGKSYLKADAAYWTKNGSAAIARIAADKYVEVPAGSAAVMGDLTVGRLLDRVFAKDISTVDTLNTKVNSADVNGVPAYLMTTKGTATKIYVSVDGLAHLLRVQSPKGGQTALDFSQWDAVPPATPPPADRVAKIPGL